jgi:RNA 2',3'-cyclic 3'-phosphodiesterase
MAMSRGATARLFVAVDMPAAVRDELAVWARDATARLGLRVAREPGQPLRLLGSEALHLTLCFLGSRPFAEIGAIGSAVSACAADVGEISVGAPLWLPPRRPRTLAVRIHDGEGELERLHRALSRAISEATGWEPERRSFRAHVTVARMRTGAAADRTRAGREPQLPATPQLRFTPESITLYRSWLSPEGATYETIATSALVPADL